MSCDQNKQMPNMENHMSACWPASGRGLLYNCKMREERSSVFPGHGVWRFWGVFHRHSFQHQNVTKQKTRQTFWMDWFSDSRCSSTQSCYRFLRRIVSHISPATPCLPPSHACHVWQPSDAVLWWDSRGKASWWILYTCQTLRRWKTVIKCSY